MSSFYQIGSGILHRSLANRI